MHWQNKLYSRLTSGFVVQRHQGHKVDVYFSEFDQFVTLRPKTSKTTVNYTRVLIVIGVTFKQNFSLTIFCKVFFRDSKSADAPLFSWVKKAFSCKYLIHKLESFLVKCKISARNYLGHSFWQDKAQHVSGCEILNWNIQKLWQ